MVYDNLRSTHRKSSMTLFRGLQNPPLGQVIMVCISDGRANVPLSVSNGEPVRIYG